MGIQDDLLNALSDMQDLQYRSFQSGLIPTLSQHTVIGVRMPALQKLAKKLLQRNDLREFLGALPHRYFEENNIHAYIIGHIPEYEQCISELKRFLPYVDNWATCDSLRPKCFRDNLDRLLPEIKKWLVSDQAYTVRFGLEMLMLWYLGDHFKPEYLALAASVNSDEYYVKMMQAWYFATALSKRYEVTKNYLSGNHLPPWVHNKAIQKAVESRCITIEQKNSLRTMKRREKV